MRLLIQVSILFHYFLYSVLQRNSKNFGGFWTKIFKSLLSVYVILKVIPFHANKIKKEKNSRFLKNYYYFEFQKEETAVLGDPSEEYRPESKYQDKNKQLRTKKAKAQFRNYDVSYIKLPW